MGHKNKIIWSSSIDCYWLISGSANMYKGNFKEVQRTSKFMYGIKICLVHLTYIYVSSSFYTSNFDNHCHHGHGYVKIVYQSELLSCVFVSYFSALYLSVRWVDSQAFVNWFIYFFIMSYCLPLFKVRGKGLALSNMFNLSTFWMWQYLTQVRRLQLSVDVCCCISFFVLSFNLLT